MEKQKLELGGISRDNTNQQWFHSSAIDYLIGKNPFSRRIRFVDNISTLNAHPVYETDPPDFPA